MGNNQTRQNDPWVGRLSHDRDKCSDWGWIRDESGALVIIVRLPDYSEEALAKHRRDGTDPTEQRVDAILAAINKPNDPSHLGHLYLEWVDTHPHIPEFAKELAKDVVAKSFRTLGASLGAIETACHRQWYADGQAERPS